MTYHVSSVALNSTDSAHNVGMHRFCRAMLCISANYAVVLWLSVCHVRALCRNGYRYGHSCNGMIIGNRIQAFERYHFQWPWVVNKLHLKVLTTDTVARRAPFWYYNLLMSHLIKQNARHQAVSCSNPVAARCYNSYRQRVAIFRRQGSRRLTILGRKEGPAPQREIATGWWGLSGHDSECLSTLVTTWRRSPIQSAPGLSWSPPGSRLFGRVRFSRPTDRTLQISLMYKCIVKVSISRSISILSIDIWILLY